MVSFECNVCGRSNQVEHFRTEPATCSCGSNVRIRALIHLLSVELFGESLALVDFPVLKSIRALGMSDQPCYATLLAEKFDYTNTYYDREPRLDFTATHPDRYGAYDFILSSDVLEHIAPPVERALEEACRLLKPNGFLGITIYCNPSDSLREHFPGLHTYRTVPLGDSMVLINRRADGILEIHDQLVFHGGSGETLEMREFGITSLRAMLLASGFCSIQLLTDNLPAIGILFDGDVSQPLIARKEPFSLNQSVVRELIARHKAVEMELNAQLRSSETDLARLRSECDRLRAQIRMAGDSRWLKLGRNFGLGPDFS